MATFESVAMKMERFKDEVSKDMKPIKQSIEDIHDKATQAGFKGYKSKSGMLDKSYTEVYKNAFQGSLILVKTGRNAPYSHAIHSGRRDWKYYNPPKFLYRAGRSREVREKIEENFQNSIKEKRKRIFN